uniref:Transmembrane 9 superfamily member n=1 Tax=Strix occidentalis caurina TaxID=311401 RepID=A0A8D0FGK3_STROC
AYSFYVPGVAPINFHHNDPVEIKAVKLTSSRTQLPYEYYSLPFCQPTKITYKAENLDRGVCQRELGVLPGNIRIGNIRIGNATRRFF